MQQSLFDWYIAFGSMTSLFLLSMFLLLTVRTRLGLVAANLVYAVICLQCLVWLFRSSIVEQKIFGLLMVASVPLIRNLHSRFQKRIK